MKTLMLIYILAVIFIYQRLKQLPLMHSMISALMIFLTSNGLAYFYPDVLSIQIISAVNTVLFMLEMTVLFIGIIYHFGYLKIKISNQAQFDSLPLMPTFVLYPRILLPPSETDIHDDFWQQYKNLK
ncbi:hypothetical protein EV694_0450 [Volucribacter psittacicida]|uniref:Uncharacterized protein n=1 Tax=Volucribacter psittacicida TaxID=203482 RepID=A0A4V2PCL6_9PAST|nr:hypothetical protein [Volucribacter psittacicida]TCK01816.1 hypothetical protein EV694_0450 [Volucribacter psittacicida]